MKKLSLAAVAALALASAAPAVAQENTVSADPFVSTQGVGALNPLFVLGGITTLVVIAGASSSSGTD